MTESGIYIPLWQKYKAAIVNKMQAAIQVPQEYTMSKYEFEAIGERNSAGYSFNLELAKGKLINNIDGSAVARDLLEVLKKSESAEKLIKMHRFKINLTKDFILKIKVHYPVIKSI